MGELLGMEHLGWELTPCLILGKGIAFGLLGDCFRLERNKSDVLAIERIEIDELMVDLMRKVMHSQRRRVHWQSWGWIVLQASKYSRPSNRWLVRWGRDREGPRGLCSVGKKSIFF